MHTFDQTVEVLRGTAESPMCDRCGADAQVCADTPVGPFNLCPEHFAQHVVVLVERRYPLTLMVGLH